MLYTYCRIPNKVKATIYNRRNHAENETGRLLPDLFLFFFFFLILHDVKASGLQISFSIIKSSTWHTIKTNCKKLWGMEPETCLILIF